jgi:hypothetical protein
MAYFGAITLQAELTKLPEVYLKILGCSPSGKIGRGGFRDALIENGNYLRCRTKEY